MNIFKNKFFLLGNLAFLLIAIPVILYFVKTQTTTRGGAAPTTTLSFIPPSLSPDQCDQTQKSRLVLNPGQNVVSTVELALKWDKTKFDIDFAPNQEAFPQTLKGPTQTTDGMTISLNIGADVTKAITTTTDVGTITIKPIIPTNGETINLEIDTANTKVYSLSPQDGPAENVYNSSGSSPLQITISAKACNETPGTNQPVNPTATPAANLTITPTSTPTAAPSTSVPTATPTQSASSPTLAANQSPICVSLTSSATTGAAPLSIVFTATGRDTDGTLTKATFNFGSGTQQDVSSGLGTASGSAQISYTYNTAGTFTATSTFTDNRGAVSATCTRQITITGSTATATPAAPTSTPTLAPIATSVPTATPTIADSGSVGLTTAVIGGIVLVVIAGIFLLAL